MCKALITPDARAVSSNGHLSLRQIPIGRWRYTLSWISFSISQTSLFPIPLYRNSISTRSRDQIFRMFQPVPTRDSPSRDATELSLFSFSCFQLFRYQSIDTLSIYFILFFRKRLPKRDYQKVFQREISRKILRFKTDRNYLKNYM